MNSAILSKEEEGIERDFDKLKPVSKEIRHHIGKIIENSRKSRPVSLRINENDLTLLKEKADENGLPYQTMINVVIHKYVTNSFLDKHEVRKFLQLQQR